MIYLKYISSLLLVTIGVLLSFSTELSETPIYVNYFSSWIICLVLSHLIPSVFMVLGVLQLLGNPSNYINYLSILFTGIILIEVSINNVFQIDNFNLITIIIAFLILNIIAFLKNNRLNIIIIKNHTLRNITILIFLILSLLVPYIISPIATYALVDNPSKNIEQRQIEILKKYIDVNNTKSDNTIVALFSTNCYYCFESAKKIGVTQRISSLENIISIFPSTLEDANIFINDANYSTKKVLCDKDDFIQLTDGRYPKFFIINESIISYNASSFQHRTIDLLSR